MSQPTAIVTGAGRGIGRASARLLAAKGYSIAAVSRTASEVQETVKLCGEDAEAFICDVTSATAVGKMIGEVADRFGRIDALVHCAGWVVMRSIEELTLQEWHGMVDTNLSSAVYLCKGLWPIWRRQGGGVVVNVSSYSARDPFAGLGAYGATKAGLNLLGLALSREGAEIGVRVHTVAPAATETSMLRSIIKTEQLPSHKTLPPEAVAKVILQCVSGDLDCTSGEVIYVHQ